MNAFAFLPGPAPFGGQEQGGFCRELGAKGVQEFITQVQYVYIDLE